MIRIGVDVGGTNTDAVVMDGAKYSPASKRRPPPTSCPASSQR